MNKWRVPSWSTSQDLQIRPSTLAVRLVFEPSDSSFPFTSIRRPSIYEIKHGISHLKSTITNLKPPPKIWQRRISYKGGKNLTTINLLILIRILQKIIPRHSCWSCWLILNWASFQIMNSRENTIEREILTTENPRIIEGNFAPSFSLKFLSIFVYISRSVDSSTLIWSKVKEGQRHPGEGKIEVFFRQGGRKLKHLNYAVIVMLPNCYKDYIIARFNSPLE